MKPHRKGCALGIVLASLALPALAWNSVGLHNHRKITIDAITREGTSVTAGNYPDIHKFYGGGDLYGDTIVDGSGTEASHKDLVWNEEKQKWEEKETWFGRTKRWKDMALEEYKERKYVGSVNTCYHHLGYVLHLEQDNFVPAHEAVLYHGWCDNDEFEWQAESVHQQEGFSYAMAGDARVYDTFSDADSRDWTYFRRDSQAPGDDDDRDEAATDANDATERDGPDGAYEVTNTWGTYGKGHWDDNLIPGNNNGGLDGGPYSYHDDDGDWFDDDVNQDAREFMIRRQLGKALVETENVLKAFSEWLPPIVYDLDVNNVYIGGATTSREIAFTIEENRKPKVKVKVMMDGTNAITDTNGKTWDGSANSEITLDSTPTSDKTVLPYKSRVTVTWDPSQAAWLTSGLHSISVSAKDENNRWSDEIEIEVFVDKKGGTGGSSTEKDK